LKKIQVKCALVTGASSGIGEQVSYLLAKKNIEKIIICGRNQQALEKIANEIRPQTQVELFAFDLGEPAGQKKLLEIIKNNTPDLVINNAGFGLYGLTCEQTSDEILSMVEVNATSVALSTTEACRALKAKNMPGIICNVSSAISFFPAPYLSVYAAAKAFVTSFSEAVDCEMEPFNIRVLTMCPGVVATGFRRRAIGIVEKDPYATISAMTPEVVAEEIWKQIQSQKRVQVIDFRTKLQILIGRLLPDKFVTRFIGQAIQELNRPH
jgi:uncharacterized protein